jgi:uncharacterized membrane protein
MCHVAEPVWAGMLWPPKGVVLETPAQIAHEARRIYLQAGVTHVMPPANLSYIEPQEREAIVRWFQGAGAASGVEGLRVICDQSATVFPVRKPHPDQA